MTIPARPFSRLLVANRGEIGWRVVREALAAGLTPIAVYSDADANSAHALAAPVRRRIGAAAPSASYLNIPAILAAAKATGAEAVHPGYGFLAENADFAEAVIEAGMIWIGPPPDAVRAMGDKGAAKRVARDAGVALIPGYDGEDQDVATLTREAAKIGWPVMIKAAMGGGGRGMRRVEGHEDFAAALASARCRFSAMRKAMSCTLANATARCSGAIRRFWKKRPRPASRRSCAPPWAPPPRNWRARSAM